MVLGCFGAVADQGSGGFDQNAAGAQGRDGAVGNKYDVAQGPAWK